MVWNDSVLLGYSRGGPHGGHQVDHPGPRHPEAPGDPVAIVAPVSPVSPAAAVAPIAPIAVAPVAPAGAPLYYVGGNGPLVVSRVAPQPV